MDERVMDEQFGRGAGVSSSALAAAAARAAHLIVDKEPYIFADTLASALLGEQAEELMLAPGLRDEAGRCYAELVGNASKERGEPWLSFFDPEGLTIMASAAGFSAVRHARQRDAVPAALWDRDDAVAAADLFALLHATVAITGMPSGPAGAS
jgi:O-methyltransferase involved in polyketide biosynthesis